MSYVEEQLQRQGIFLIELAERLKQFERALTGPDGSLGGHTHEVAASGLQHVTITAATYTALGTDEIIGVNRAGVVTVTLPTAQAAILGKAYIINDESGAAYTNNITVATQGAETIDGAATYVIGGNYGSMGFVSNGTNWFTV